VRVEDQEQEAASLTSYVERWTMQRSHDTFLRMECVARDAQNGWELLRAIMGGRNDRGAGSCRAAMDRGAERSVDPSPLPVLLTLVHTVIRVALCRGSFD